MMSSAAVTALRIQLSRQVPAVASSDLIASRSFAASSYADEKKADKERRRELFLARQENAERVKTRRDGRDVGAKRKLFDSWFSKKKIWNHIQERRARQAGMEWQIDCALIIERLPIVTPHMPQWARDWEDLRSYLDSFGKDYPKELNLGERFAMGEYLTDEQMIAQLPEGYKPGPRITEADTNGEVKTMKRRLAERVYFLAQKNGKWIFPTVTLAGDETFSDAAKRAVLMSVGEEMDIYYVSNCPMAVDMHIVPEAERAKVGFYGTKTFFMKVQHDEFDATLGAGFDDYAWLARDEIADRMKAQNGHSASRFFHYIL